MSDDEEDLEALRMQALASLKRKTDNSSGSSHHEFKSSNQGGPVLAKVPVSMPQRGYPYPTDPAGIHSLPNLPINLNVQPPVFPHGRPNMPDPGQTFPWGRNNMIGHHGSRPPPQMANTTSVAKTRSNLVVLVGEAGNVKKENPVERNISKADVKPVAAKPTLIRPQDKWLSGLSDDNSQSSLPAKPKDKFSRYDKSDSEEESDDELSSSDSDQSDKEKTSVHNFQHSNESLNNIDKENTETGKVTCSEREGSSSPFNMNKTVDETFSRSPSPEDYTGRRRRRRRRSSESESSVSSSVSIKSSDSAHSSSNMTDDAQSRLCVDKQEVPNSSSNHDQLHEKDNTSEDELTNAHSNDDLKKSHSFKEQDVVLRTEHQSKSPLHKDNSLDTSHSEHIKKLSTKRGSRSNSPTKERFSPTNPLALYIGRPFEKIQISTYSGKKRRSNSRKRSWSSSLSPPSNRGGSYSPRDRYTSRSYRSRSPRRSRSLSPSTRSPRRKKQSRKLNRSISPMRKYSRSSSRGRSRSRDSYSNLYSRKRSKSLSPTRRRSRSREHHLYPYNRRGNSTESQRRSPKRRISKSPHRNNQSPVRMHSTSERWSPGRVQRRPGSRSPVRIKRRSESRSPRRSQRKSDSRSPGRGQKRLDSRSPLRGQWRPHSRSPGRGQRRPDSRSPGRSKRRPDSRSPGKGQRKLGSRSPGRVQKRLGSRSPSRRSISPYISNYPSCSRSPNYIGNRSEDRKKTNVSAIKISDRQATQRTTVSTHQSGTSQKKRSYSPSQKSTSPDRKNTFGRVLKRRKSSPNRYKNEDQTISIDSKHAIDSKLLSLTGQYPSFDDNKQRGDSIGKLKVKQDEQCSMDQKRSNVLNDTYKPIVDGHVMEARRKKFETSSVVDPSLIPKMTISLKGIAPKQKKEKEQQRQNEKEKSKNSQEKHTFKQKTLKDSKSRKKDKKRKRSSSSNNDAKTSGNNKNHRRKVSVSSKGETSLSGNESSESESESIGKSTAQISDIDSDDNQDTWRNSKSSMSERNRDDIERERRHRIQLAKSKNRKEAEQPSRENSMSNDSDMHVGRMRDTWNRTKYSRHVLTDDGVATSSQRIRKHGHKTFVEIDDDEKDDDYQHLTNSRKLLTTVASSSSQNVAEDSESSSKEKEGFSKNLSKTDARYLIRGLKKSKESNEMNDVTSGVMQKPSTKVQVTLESEGTCSKSSEKLAVHARLGFPLGEKSSKQEKSRRTVTEEYPNKEKKVKSKRIVTEIEEHKTLEQKDARLRLMHKKNSKLS